MLAKIIIAYFAVSAMATFAACACCWMAGEADKQMGLK